MAKNTSRSPRETGRHWTSIITKDKVVAKLDAIDITSLKDNGFKCPIWTIVFHMSLALWGLTGALLLYNTLQHM